MPRWDKRINVTGHHMQLWCAPLLSVCHVQSDGRIQSQAISVVQLAEYPCSAGLHFGYHGRRRNNEGNPVTRWGLLLMHTVSGVYRSVEQSAVSAVLGRTYTVWERSLFHSSVTSALLFSLIFYYFPCIRAERSIACSWVQNFDNWSFYPSLNLLSLPSLPWVSKVVFLNSLKKPHWIKDSFSFRFPHFASDSVLFFSVHNATDRTNTQSMPIGPTGSPRPEIRRKNKRNSAEKLQ